MSEQTAPTTGTENTTNEQATEAKSEFQAITSQEDFDKAIQARIARERAKFADYEDLKARADKFDEYQESQKTEAERAQERLQAAEARAAELELRSIRAEVAAEKGVPVALLTGSTKDEITASADALIAFRGEQRQQDTYTVPAAGQRPEMALNGGGIESALKSALGIR
ncbi:hypothetical protein NS183_07790 [Microbacterium testaceum]|uniref:DUF4355 domain-containing protein n=1 Tax=Microbacterium testaceum TaxID=2033 RepID=UPI000796C1C3|nr:DUF4355 domain-containing protein [Microbacterium testaceum]KTS90702.1 hypothetical protein NS183_07790 [Microbacterium testaceum]